MTASPAQPSSASGQTVTTPTQSRAVLREIQAGSLVNCTYCGDRIKWQAKSKKPQVICNVYIRGKWNRTEHFHQACYAAAGAPHGQADTTRQKPKTRNKRA